MEEYYNQSKVLPRWLVLLWPICVGITQLYIT